MLMTRTTAWSCPRFLRKEGRKGRKRVAKGRKGKERKKGQERGEKGRERERERKGEGVKPKYNTATGQIQVCVHMKCVHVRELC